MSLRSYVVLALGCLSLSQAQANGPAKPEADKEMAADLRTIQTCLKREYDYGDRTRCVGVVAKTCESEPAEGYPSVHALACREREANAWDRVLNETYKRRMMQFQSSENDSDALKARRIETLRSAQRLWIQFRDAEMIRMKVDSNAAAASWGLANIESVRLEMTAKRTIDLD